VKRIVRAVALYPGRQHLQQEYPDMEDEDLRQVLESAATCLDNEAMPLGAAWCVPCLNRGPQAYRARP